MRGRFVAYYRVSTDKQGRSGLGLEAQKVAVAAYLDGGDWELVDEFTEIETGKRNDRPKLAEAIARAKATKAKLIIAKLDRLARNVAFVATLMETKINFVAADNPTADRFTIHILAAVAEKEAADIATRTKAALAAARARGIKLGNYDRIAKAKTKATVARYETVRSAIEATAAMTANAAAIRLNVDGITTPAGGTWQAGQILRARRHLEVAALSSAASERCGSSKINWQL